MAGPAISTARAVPAEAPAANSDRARGISKNEGMVSTSAETMTTRTMAITNRIPAMDRGNSRNEKVRAAGFKAGAARVNANDGPKRRLRRYTAGNIGATQQEHNIKGAPAAAAASCGLTRPCPNSVAKCRGETVAWTAALMRTPNTSAGQTIFR